MTARNDDPTEPDRHAWKTRHRDPGEYLPGEIRMETEEGGGVYFQVHPDGKVYRETRAGMRRVKDEAIRRHVVERLRRRMEVHRRAGSAP